MPASRRLILINYEYPPVGGGGGNATQHLARGFARLGHVPMVLTAAWGDLPRMEHVDGVTIRRIPAFRQRADRCSIPEMAAFTTSAMLSAPGLARQWRAEAALVFFAVPCGPIGWLLKRMNRLPYAISLQGGDVPGFDPGTLSRHHQITGGAIRYLWRDAHAVVANSLGLADLARRHAPNQSIGVIPAGADIAGIAAKQNYASSLDIQLLFVGRLVKQKGLDVLLEALARISPALRWKLTLVGDGPEWATLAGQAARFKFPERVSLRGWVNKEELAVYYGAADIFVLPSRDEGMANALLEAMAAGLPVVATRIAGTNEVMIDGVTGLLAEAGDPETLANALTALMTDPAKRESFGRAARARVATAYDWNVIATQWAEVLEDAIVTGLKT